MIAIRAAAAADAGAIAAIYAAYVTGTAITFELAPPDAAEMARRIARVQARFPWLVAADGPGAILGYAYAGAFNARAAYRWVAETTIYLAPGAQRQGIGRTLYETLLAQLAAQGIVSVTGLIALPNPGSVGLHEALGFAHVGSFRQVGYKLGRWHDVGYWQKELAPRADPPAEPGLPAPQGHGPAA